MGYYSVTKAEAAQLVLDASVVHPSGICGPNDFSYGPVAKFILDYAGGGMKAGIAGTFNSVDVRDLDAGVIACCQKGRRGECYVMSNEMVTMEEMFQIINEAAGLHYRPSFLSPRTAHWAAKLLSLGSHFTGKPALLTDFAIYNLTRNNDFDCSKAQRELGFSCRPFAETIRDEVNWLMEIGRRRPGRSCSSSRRPFSKSTRRYPDMYCPSCGKELLPGAALCPHCKLQISAGSGPASNQNRAARPQAGDGSRLAKGLTALLGAALAGACGLLAAELLVVGACLMFRFAQGTAVALPWFLAETLLIDTVSDGALLFIGLTILLAAVLLSIAAGTLVQGLKFLLRKPAETADF